MQGGNVAWAIGAYLTWPFSAPSKTTLSVTLSCTLSSCSNMKLIPMVMCCLLGLFDKSFEKVSYEHYSYATESFHTLSLFFSLSLCLFSCSLILPLSYHFSDLQFHLPPTVTGSDAIAACALAALRVVKSAEKTAIRGAKQRVPGLKQGTSEERGGWS